MSFDGIVTRAVVHELNEELVSGRILKIYQPTNTELVLTVRAKGKNQQLLLSVHPNYSRIHITNDSFINPQEPPMFCMVLRKYLSSGFIESISQKELERIIEITIKSRDEIGDISYKKLIVEIMGKHSNIILVDAEKNVILDSIKHVSISQNRYRTILPGQPYLSPPSQDKLNPLNITGEQFIKKLDFNSGKLDQQIISKFMGISPLMASELIDRAHLGSNEKYKQVFEEFQSTLLNHQYQSIIYRGEKELFYALDLSSINLEREFFISPSRMLDSFFSGKAERDRVKQQAGDIYRHISNERNKILRKLKKHETTMKKAEKADDYKRLGELLTAHLHLIHKGDMSVIVIDYYDPEQGEVEINLDQNKTPSENAQKYFQQYQKLKKSKEYVSHEIEKANEEILYLEQLLLQLETAREQDLDEIREELQEQGYLRKKAINKKKKQAKKQFDLDEYFSKDGTLILVGRNNKQNEYLTNKLANRNHIWLHAKDIPGSHVVIQDANPSDETIEDAAILAAYYSKAKLSSSVPIDYTQIKHVKKPSGSKPGFVIYEQQRTIYVTPDEKIVHQLKSKK